MRCIVIDDEPLARMLIEGYISRIDGLKLVRSFSNAVEAFGFLQVNEPVDVLFLDIQMPQMTGIEFLKSLKQPPKVIFTTAYRKYAIDAFDLDVVDYLLKPVSFERFLRSIGKIYQFRQLMNNTEKPDLQNALKQAYLLLKENRATQKVYLSEIVYIESLRDYIRVKTTNGQIITHQKISYMEQKLPESAFLRVHRSFIVALDKVTSFQSTHVNLGTVKIPIGKLYKNMALKALNDNKSLKSA